MTEPQFAYNAFTLDELRSLAASPQVGTLQAMPQAFHDLANRVGEVADLLSHAQADLPNWWKGPAAEQAAATLGRAAAEARDFHESAMGAAMAVGRCAQVVAEQQHQMMKVPEVAEPGITAVVQRPATPFDALEAARRDAAYQAAHEQAVQVVNGIAAQYVETRGQLGAAVQVRGEDFNTTATPNQPAGGSATALDSSPTTETARAAATTTSGRQPSQLPYKSPLYARKPISTQPLPTPLRSLRHRPSEAEATISVALTPGFLSSKFTPPTSSEKNSPPIPQSKTNTNKNSRFESTAADSYETPASAVESALLEESAGSIGSRKAYDPTDHSGIRAAHERAIMSTKNTVERGESKGTERRHSAPRHEFEIPTAPIAEAIYPPSPRAAYNRPLDDTHSNNSAMIPPYGGIGSVPRGREDRSPRPSYLKERKSVWVPDTVAAPADGVITPDWFEQP